MNHGAGSRFFYERCHSGERGGGGVTVGGGACEGVEARHGACMNVEREREREERERERERERE